MLTRDQAKRFYDKFGAKQDAQGFYEDPAIEKLLLHAEFDKAGSVFEFGCGTGRFAARILNGLLPSDATYRGVDLSSTMIALSKTRLDPFGDRATASQSDGLMKLDVPEHSLDRIVSNYVLDLLPDDDISTLIAQAQRALKPGGRLCLISLTRGSTFFSRLLTSAWLIVHGIRPQLVGGCRPIHLKPFLPESQWTILHFSTVVAWGIPSEILVATPTAETLA